MTRCLYLLLFVLTLCPAIVAQNDTPTKSSAKVRTIKMPENSNAGAITGDLKEGDKLSTLRWAENSAVACFPGTRFEQFNGSHVFYRVFLPAASAMKITLFPKDGRNINIYALRQSTQGAQPVPPDITKAISCEASYPIYAILPGGKRVENEDTKRSVEYISVTSPFNVLIGVAGAQGLTEGEFNLLIEINPR